MKKPNLLFLWKRTLSPINDAHEEDELERKKSKKIWREGNDS